MDENNSNENSKPWYQSTTIISAITTGIIAVAGIFKLQIGDLSPDIQNGLLGLGAFISVGITVYGRIKASKGISLPTRSNGEGPMPPTAAAIVALLLIPVLMVNCSSTTTSSNSATQTTTIVAPAENTTFINSVAMTGVVLKAGGQLALALAVNDADRKTYATYLSGSGHFFESFETGSLPTSEQVTRALAAYFPTTSGSYTTIVQISATAINAVISIIKNNVPATYINYADYVNYCFSTLAKVAYEVADPYLE